LYNNGSKISKIASLEKDEISTMVREIALKSNSEQVAINALKLSMVNFDTSLFDVTYEEILLQNDFEFVYVNVFMPLMSELGILWQTNAISPSHEHFITNLIKQKIHIQTEFLQKDSVAEENSKLFILFLPEDEIHDLGLLFLNYFILKNGYKTIFLGQSLQTESLETLINLTNDICFVTYLTVEPNKDEINYYIKDFNDRLLKNKSSNLVILGPQQVHINASKLSKNIKLFKSIRAFQDKFLKTSIYV
jgi:methanogenic corrinoid protein MtbC1